MNISIDIREKGSSKLPNTRKERAYDYYSQKHTVEIKKLDYGDYIFNDIVAFEYKTIEDMMNSINNSSVFEEVSNQTMNYTYSYLIIVGSLAKYIDASYYAFRKKQSKRNWAITQHNKFDGAIRRIRTICPVITVHSEEKAFKEMEQQSKKCLNNKLYGGTKRSIQTKDIITHTLGGCGGISEKKATKIKEELQLQNITDLTRITKKDLLSVDGVGEKTSTKIMKWLQCSE